MRVDLVLDLTPQISEYEDKEFASLSYIEYDIVYPGEMFLGSDRIPGTSDDFLYDPDGFDATEEAYKWEFDLLSASSNIAASNYDPNQRYYGFGYYDGGGLSSWFIPGLIWYKPELTGNQTYGWGFDSIDAGHWNASGTVYFPYYAVYESMIVSSSIYPYSSPVPEPATALLIFLGLTVFSSRRRSKK